MVSRSTSHSSHLHGLSHWERVGRNGLDLAADTEGADADVVLLFALFHDSMRLNDGHDPEHGHRGGGLARELREAPTPRPTTSSLCCRRPALVIPTA